MGTVELRICIRCVGATFHWLLFGERVECFGCGHEYLPHWTA